jgi:hypothetical protein
MLTKTRTAAIAFLSTVAVAGAAVAPAVSEAQAIDPGTKAATCEVLRLTAGLWEELEQEAFRKNEVDLGHRYAERKEQAVTEAQAAGCSWSRPAIVISGGVKVKVSGPVVAKPIPSKPAAARRLKKTR